MHQFAPRFRIQIDGDNIPAALRDCITGVTYHSGIEGADRVELNLANPNLRWLDHPLLQMDNGFSLWMGYAPDPLEEVFVGEITGVEASFPGGGMPTLTVAAHDFLQRMSKGKKDRAFRVNVPTIGHFPLPDPAVAALVSVTNGLIPALDPVGSALSFLTLLLAYAADPDEAKKGVRLQQGESDFEFLTTIARENGWELYIDHTLDPKGYVLRFPFLIQDYTPALVLKYGESLLDFTPRITTVGQIASVSTRIWLPSIQIEIVLVLAWNYDRATFDLMVYPGLGSLAEILDEEAQQSVLTVDAVGPVSAPRQILTELLPRLNNRLTCSGNALGDLRIRAGRVLGIDGVGDEFGGLYRITSVSHSLDSGGFRTSFEGRQEVWFGSIPLPKGNESLVRLQRGG